VEEEPSRKPMLAYLNSPAPVIALALVLYIWLLLNTIIEPDPIDNVEAIPENIDVLNIEVLPVPAVVTRVVSNIPV
jgi:hypothetical protein